MATAEFHGSTRGVRPAVNWQSTGDGTSREKLQVLFAEATALVNQLRKTAASVPQQAHSPVGSCGVLQVLDRQGPLTVPAIARSRAVSRQSTQTLINRLEAQGCVALVANPAHKTSGLVHLTDRGRRLLAAVIEEEAKSSNALLPYVSESRLVPAARLLRQLRELLVGDALRPAEMVEERSARKRVKALPRPAHRNQAGPAPADLPLLPVPTEADESEFPLSLL